MSTRLHRFSSGVEAHLRPVPPYLLAALSSQLPLPPVYPKLKLESPAGTEEAPALPDSPEYIEYRQKQREWQKMRSDKIGDFCMDYCVMDWKLPDQEEWQEEPSEAWEIDPVLVRWGLGHLGENRRVAFIAQEIILSDEDMDVLEAVANSKGIVTEEAVQQALVPFVSNVGEDQSTGQQEVPAG